MKRENRGQIAWQDQTPEIGQESRPSQIDVEVVAASSNIRLLSEEYHLLDIPTGEHSITLPRECVSRRT